MDSSALRTQDDWFTLAVQGASLAVEGSLVSSSNIQTTGNALVQSSAINLVSVDNGYGAAWSKSKIDLSKDWSTSFVMNAGGGSGTSDGFTVTINGDPRGISALGDGGQNLGFFGLDTGFGITNSYAVLFDMWTSGPASLLGFAQSTNTSIPQGTFQLPLSLANKSYSVSLNYSATNRILSVTIGNQVYQQSIDLQSTLGTSAYLGLTAANGGGTMDMVASAWDITATGAVQEGATLPGTKLFGNSLYAPLALSNEDWFAAQSKAVGMGGNIASVNTAQEQNFIASQYGIYYSDIYLGNRDLASDGIDNIYKNADGSAQTYSNWLPGYPELRPTTGAVAVLISRTYFNSWESGWFTNGWYSGNPEVVFNSTFVDPNSGELASGVIGEYSLNSSITFSPSAKEGQTLTTTINLSAGAFNRTDLAEGAQVWWKVTGITADDLVSGQLTGSGIITNGKLDLQHSLAIDTDLGESFEVSLYSDASMASEYQIGTKSSVAVQEKSPVIRANSLYKIASGPRWTDAENYSQSLGGHLAAITSEQENQFISSAFKEVNAGDGYNYLGNYDLAIVDLYWMGLYKDETDAWRWSTGEFFNYKNWTSTNYDGNQFRPELQRYGTIQVEKTNLFQYDPNNGATWQAYADGVWSPDYNEVPEGRSGIAEIPLNLSITRQGEVKEGSGVFSTSINLSAGNAASGNLAEGAQVWWKITGITADDLVSGSLSGNGIITNGKLDLQHSLAIDTDPGESFEVSVYSDAGMTQKIGNTNSTVAKEADPVIRGNSLYKIVNGYSWTSANSIAHELGGNLLVVDSNPEKEFLVSKYATPPITSEEITFGAKTIQFWMGISDSASEGDWVKPNGSPIQYANWGSGEPNNYIDEDYAAFLLYQTYNRNPGEWADIPDIADPRFAGLAELTLNPSVTFSNAKEGEILGTTINLSAGTLNRTDLVEGAQVWWQITGITADDLDAGSPSGLSGSGIIQNGALTLTHFLKEDGAIESETLSISLFSDALMTVESQIGIVRSIQIQDANNAPTNLTLSTSTLNENITAGSIVGTLGTTDPDVEDTFVYSLVSGAGSTDNSAFSIIGNQLRINTSPDYETKSIYNIRIRTTDVGGLTYEKEVVLQVNNINEAPTDLILTSSGILENSPAGTVIGTLAATDPDAGSTFSYALVAGNGTNDADNALVEIVGNEVKVKSGAAIDFETNPTLNLNIQVTDNGGLTYTKAVTAAVLNVNEAPTDLTFTSSGINENSPAGTVIGTLAATDPDAGSTFSYALVAGNGTNDADNALVEIVGNEVKVKSGAAIDFETNPTLNLNIQVTDNGTLGLTYTKAVTAAVLNVNEAPTDLTFTSSGINENSPAGTVIGTLAATDPDAGSTFSYALVAGNGTNDADNTLVEIVGNEVKVKSGAAIDFETNPTLNLNIQVTDNGGLTYTRAVTAAVLDVVEIPPDNTLPTISSISTQGTTVILKFSETISPSGVLPSAFSVVTLDSKNNATNRSISAVTQDLNDPSRIILTLTGTAPASTVNLRVSYTDPAGNQTTGVVQDLAGNDLATFANRFADTFITGSTTTIANQYQNLTLTGTSAVSGTGNNLGNIIAGNSANNTLTGLAGNDTLIGEGGNDTLIGGAGADLLIGGAGTDTFRLTRSDSLLSSFDRITDFAIGTDHIDGPSAVTAANLRELGTVSALTQTGIAAVLTSSTFVSNGAATFSFMDGTTNRTFLALNNATAGFSSSTDAVIDITGYSGVLTNLAVV